MAATAHVLTDAQKELLDEKHLGVVTDLMPDGTPHSTVVWVDRDGDVVQFNTARGRLKTRNLERDPRISLVVFDPANPFQRTVAVRGRAQFVDEGADAHIDRLARKYMGADSYPFRRPGEVRVTVRVIPDRISGP